MRGRRRKSKVPSAVIYPDGYKPKMKYWLDRLSEAIENDDIEDVNFYADKIIYFANRHVEKYKNS